jgi:hypothetical protein
MYITRLPSNLSGVTVKAMVAMSLTRGGVSLGQIKKDNTNGVRQKYCMQEALFLKIKSQR